MKPIRNDSAPFGQHAPRGLVARMLDFTRKPHGSWFRRRAVFVCRSFGIGLLRGDPLDVESLGARMRLYPSRNVSEKNLLFTPHLFDPDERKVLEGHIRPGFTFVDVGANVGGYSLFVAALAARDARVLAIEPQPEIFERLAFNVGQNPAGNIKALECAVADQDGAITLFIDPRNRGATSMRFVTGSTGGESLKVQARTLKTILEDEGFERLDALKVDVEGAEDLILEPFFRDADPRLWPQLLIVDTSGPEPSVAGSSGTGDGGPYRLVLRTRSNCIYQRRP